MVPKCNVDAAIELVNDVCRGLALWKMGRHGTVFDPPPPPYLSCECTSSHFRDGKHLGPQKFDISMPPTHTFCCHITFGK